MNLSLLVAGLLQILAAWSFFRLRGQGAWAVMPIWRANQSLTPVGVALWVGGFSLIIAGVLVNVLPAVVNGAG